MIDEEIGHDPEAFQLGQHDGRPAIVRGAGARIDGKMRRVVGITSLSRHDDDAHFDGHLRVSRLHLLNVSGRIGGISVRIMGNGMGIGFPRAIAFIANFPILETAIIGFVGRSHPGRRLTGSAGAIIDGGENLSAQIGGDGHEGGIPGRVAGPMIGVRSRAARPAQGRTAGLFKQRQRLVELPRLPSQVAVFRPNWRASTVRNACPASTPK